MKHEEMKGLLFLNEKKMSDKSPDYKGSTLINGKIYYISLWKRVGKESGQEFFSLSFKEKLEGETVKKQEVKHTPQEQVNEMAQAVGGNTEIISDEPIEASDVPF